MHATECEFMKRQILKGDVRLSYRSVCGVALHGLGVHGLMDAARHL